MDHELRQQEHDVCRAIATHGDPDSDFHPEHHYGTEGMDSLVILFPVRIL